MKTDQRELSSGFRWRPTPRGIWTVLSWTHYIAVFPFTLLYVLWVYIPWTRYPPRYSEKAFKRLQIGMPLCDVYALIGEPLLRLEPWWECWRYNSFQIYFDENKKAMTHWYDYLQKQYIELDMGNLPISVSTKTLQGRTQEAITDVLGAPDEKVVGNSDGASLLYYTQPSFSGELTDRTWRRRIVTVDTETKRVTDIVSDWLIAGD